MKTYLIKEESVARAQEFIKDRGGVRPTAEELANGARICPPDCGMCNDVAEAAKKIIAAGVGGTIEQTGVNEVTWRFRLEVAPPPAAPVVEDTFLEKLRGAADGRDDDLTATTQGELEEQHESLMDTLAAAPLYEGEFVLGRLRRGKVDGTTFGEGDRACSCLLGTMATAANVVEKKEYGDGSWLGEELAEKYGVNHYRAQDLFSGIYEGDRPSTSKSAAIADQFITELLMSNRAELGREEAAAWRTLRRAGLMRRAAHRTAR